MDRSDWMSDSGYESGQRAESPARKGMAITSDKRNPVLLVAAGLLTVLACVAALALVGKMAFPWLVWSGAFFFTEADYTFARYVVGGITVVFGVLMFVLVLACILDFVFVFLADVGRAVLPKPKS